MSTLYNANPEKNAIKSFKKQTKRSHSTTNGPKTGHFKNKFILVCRHMCRSTLKETTERFIIGSSVTKVITSD